MLGLVLGLSSMGCERSQKVETVPTDTTTTAPASPTANISTSPATAPEVDLGNVIQPVVRRVEEKQNLEFGPSNQAIHLATPKRRVPGMRYDPAKDPALSEAAARAYYTEQIRISQERGAQAKLDEMMQRLQGTGDLRTWIDMAVAYEHAPAVPQIVALMHSAPRGFNWHAAEALCAMGDRRGFDFILQQLGGADAADWRRSFKSVFNAYLPAGYEEALLDYLSTHPASPLLPNRDRFMVALVLARLGDVRALDTLLPMMEETVQKTSSNVLALIHLKDPRVLAYATRLTTEGITEEVREAAHIVLAHQGEAAEWPRIGEQVRRLLGTPAEFSPPQQGLPPGRLKTFPSIYWEDIGVMALEAGVSALPEEQALPLLREIALKAPNPSYHLMAIRQLTRHGGPQVRAILMELAAALQQATGDEVDSQRNLVAHSLLLYDDAEAEAAAQTLRSKLRHSLDSPELCRFRAKARGWLKRFDVRWTR